MPKRKSPIERKATQHHEFIGEAAAERAKAQEVKKEHLAAEREQDVVREMAAEMREMADKPELRIPRSVEEGKRLFAEAPERLREKAQERLDAMPAPARQLMGYAQAAAGLLFAPARFGVRLVRAAVQLPAAVFHVLRNQEA